MKITAVKGYPVMVGHRNQFVVRIETDEGLHGLGEGGISGRALAMQGMLDHFRHALVGQDRDGSSTFGSISTGEHISKAGASPPL